jgi:hypothetical protein
MCSCGARVLELLAATAARVADATKRRRAAEVALSAPGVSLDALGTSSGMRAVGQQVVAARAERSHHGADPR